MCFPTFFFQLFLQLQLVQLRTQLSTLFQSGKLHCNVLCHNPARPIARRLYRKDSAAETAPHPLRCANFLPFTIRREATWRCASTSASIKWRSSPAWDGAEAGGGCSVLA